MRKLNTFLPRSTMLGAGPASAYTIAAGVFVAVLQVLNQLLLAGASLSTVRDAAAVLIGAAGAYGIQPLFGPALTNLIHIPSQVLFFVAAGISVGNGVLSVLNMTSPWHAVLAGVLTLVGAVLFGSPVLDPPAHRNKHGQFD